MNSLNGRVRKLEQQLLPDPKPDDSYTVVDLAGDVLEAIARGDICNHCDNLDDIAKYPDFEFSGLMDPTISDQLDDDGRSIAWGLLHHAQNLVRDVAGVTGWRSPISLAGVREYRQWRANSVEELEYIMRSVIHAA